MSKIKGKQLEVPEDEDPQKEMEELKKIIYDFEKGVVEKYVKEKGDINMSKIKEIFGVEVGEEFYLKWNFEEFCDKTMKYHFGADDYLYRSDNSLSAINPLSMLLGVYGETKIVKIEKPILDDVEKKFLGNLIRPFEVDYIYKGGVCFGEKLYILIRLTNGETIELPYFSSKSKMYKGMEAFRPYTPEELGL